MTLLTLVWPLLILRILAWISLLLFLGVLYFFRDPRRKSPSGATLVLAPADGRVVAIDEELTDDYVGQTKLVSIFLSLLDVHINRIPFAGKIKDLSYTKGRFLPAFNPKASFSNENLVTCIENGELRFKVKQISGLLARRIINHLKVGAKVQKGERFGMIKFGSRVDLYLPAEVNLKVKLNQKVKAGETIMAELP